jgi:hypothetical protein
MSWTLKLSQEDGGCVHVVGVVSDSHMQWEEYCISTQEGVSYWVAQNNRVWTCGKLLEETAIFRNGERVILTLDRQVHTLTVIGSQSTVIIPDLPKTELLYPVLAFTDDSQYAELLDYMHIPAAVDAVSRASQDGASSAPEPKVSAPCSLSFVSPFANMKLFSPFYSHIMVHLSSHLHARNRQAILVTNLLVLSLG